MFSGVSNSLGSPSVGVDMDAGGAERTELNAGGGPLYVEPLGYPSVTRRVEGAGAALAYSLTGYME